MTFIVWLIIIIAGILAYILFPELYNASFLTNLVEQYEPFSFFIYFILILIQGLIFIPLPLVIVGIIIFDPVEVFIINMLSVFISAMIIYYFSEYIGFGKYFEENYNKDVQKIRKSLKNRELFIIIILSLLPFTPTNLIAYIGSTLKINVVKCILGIVIGEAVVNIFYIITIRMIIKTVIA
jgi:uncharacterized membrane protein YdjX (TVP38/TMEM64 family)